jgi:hypothetical protein
VERLTKIWRQSDENFLTAINEARAGNGATSAEVLESLGCFHEEEDEEFNGVTIYPTNKQVDKLNKEKLDDIVTAGGEEFTRTSMRWGIQRPEWKQIPFTMPLAVGAYVMILTNDNSNMPGYGLRGRKMLRYANGSCGHVSGFTEHTVMVKLESSGETVAIPRVSRQVLSDNAPDGCEIPKHLSDGAWRAAENLMHSQPAEYVKYLRSLTEMGKPGFGSPYYDFEEEKWIVGEVIYVPLRLAYALTVHKTQGLTLDHVQINPKHEFFGSPGMAYVALSRVKDWRNLRIVGGPDTWARRCNVAAEVVRWI